MKGQSCDRTSLTGRRRRRTPGLSVPAAGDLEMTTVAVPFVRTEASQNPNLRVRRGEDPAEPYMRAMTVAFASVRRWNPDFELQLISNAAPEGNHLHRLDQLGVSYAEVPFAHRPPEGFTSRFEASLYMLDALRSLTAQSTVLIDPDVLCMDSLHPLLNELSGSAAALDMCFPESEDINGLTRTEAGQLHAELGEPSLAPAHYGGEMYVIPLAVAQQIIDRCESAWQLSLRRHAQGLSKFTTEEHILSYALRGVPVKNLDRYIRRIWTSYRYRQVYGTEGELALWHLPAEKDRGFRELYSSAIDDRSWFWQSDRAEFVERCGRAMGFHHRPAVRFAKDMAGYTVSRAQGIFLR